MENKIAQLYNPQVFFAAERTLLAWQRSSISFIALGFVIEKFGIFIKYLKIASNIGVKKALLMGWSRATNFLRPIRAISLHPRELT